MMGNYYGDMFGFGLGGGIMMILFWAALIFFIVWIVREIGGKHNSTGSDKTRPSESALNILKERYAKGEIDKKEFEEKKRDVIN